MKLNLSTKKHEENKETEILKTVHLRFDSELKGLELATNESRSTSDILTGYTLVSDSQDVQLWHKDINEDVYDMAVSTDNKLYLLIYNSGIEYTVEIVPTLCARDMKGNKHYSSANSLYAFLKNYSALLPIFNLVVGRIGK